MRLYVLNSKLFFIVFMSPAAVLMASPVASHTLSAGMNQQPQRHEGAKKNHLANKERL
jgi:hypothetical protein